MHTYAFTQSAGAMQQMAPAMDMAMQQMMNNPNIPQAQKDPDVIHRKGLKVLDQDGREIAPEAPQIT